MSNSVLFRTADEAAVHALLDILPTSIRRQQEYAGYIFQVVVNGQIRFCYNVPLRPTGMPEGGAMPPAPIMPPRARLVATMHTHPFNKEWIDEQVGITSLKKPPHFSPDIDVPGRREIELNWQRSSPGPIDMYVIDIHKEISVLEGKRGTRGERERIVRSCSDLTCI